MRIPFFHLCSELRGPRRTDRFADFTAVPICKADGLKTTLAQIELVNHPGHLT